MGLTLLVELPETVVDVIKETYFVTCYRWDEIHRRKYVFSCACKKKAWSVEKQTGI